MAESPAFCTATGLISLQDDDGQILDGHSISVTFLDYPGIGPGAFLAARYGPRHLRVREHDREALAAFQLCTRLEGIIPALEPAHALAYVTKLAPSLPPSNLLVMNMCGRGDKDIFAVVTTSDWKFNRRSARNLRIEWSGCSVYGEHFCAFVGGKEEGVHAVRHGGRSRLCYLARNLEGAGLKAGADIIELGLPFSDPMADGPAIQRSSQRALRGGQTLHKTLDMVRAFRQTDNDTPVVLMGYYNPIYVYPVPEFLADAVESGIDGLIVVDVPPEADDELCLPALAAGLNFIRLTAPTTTDRRLERVLTNSSGFVYYGPRSLALRERARPIWVRWSAMSHVSRSKHRFRYWWVSV